MKTKNYVSAGTLIIMLLSHALALYGQEIPKVRTKIPTYVDVNRSSEDDIFEILDGFMSIQYHDVVGVSKTLELSIYNWKSELEGKFDLDKVLGLNHYSIQLDEIGIHLDKSSIYHCVIRDEIKNEFKWAIREATKPEGKIVPEIIVNPIQTNCAELTEQSVIEFYGGVTGGNAPYALTWYVLDKTKTKFLYQPKEETIAGPDITSMITVDKSPEYYVMLHVSDGCGNTSEKMVLITCQEAKKRISTVFVNPLDELRNVNTAPTKTN